jgi:hypothetical protein
MPQKIFFIGFLVLILLTSAAAGALASPPGVISIQEGSLETPGWQQVNSSGFGDAQAVEVSALESFNGYLYAGTHNPVDPAPGQLYDGAQIFRSPDGMNWEAVTEPGFGNTHDIAAPAILDFLVFNQRLYASTGRGNASQVWRSLNGTTWAPVDVTGFSDADNVDVTALVEYGGKIYAGVANQVNGVQIWSSFTGDNNTWTQVAPTAPGTDPARVTGFAVFEGALFAAVESQAPAQIWQTFGGGWTSVVSNGFGDSQTLYTGGLAVFQGYLYVGAGNNALGAQIWRSADGENWEQVINPAFGDPNNRKIASVFVFQGQLYTSAENTTTGLEVWRSADGLLWEQVNRDGFGDSANTRSNWGNSASVFENQLYTGTRNELEGGELWRMGAQQELLYIPITTR